MHTLILVTFGLIVGSLASLPRSQTFWDIILGMIGATAGGLIISSFGMPVPAGYGFYSFIVALMGAVMIIFIGRFLEEIPLS
jgi:uncharacterized membrane protein YeaQ/YmgE (transglycosylase-associated protein family)